jgi:myo-inositol-1(or 4)-monophosphatase
MPSLAEDVLPLVRETRDMLMPYWGNPGETGQKSAYATDIVTKLDTDVEAFLRERLAALVPDAAFVGEEFGGDRSARKFFLCDPIDGTQLYARGMPFCTTMLALVEGGEAVFSVIYDFTADVMYHAEKGKGAYKNGQPIRVSTRDLHGSYLFYETHIDVPENQARYYRLRERTGLLKYMCAGYEYALVAEGKIEGRVNFSPWGKDYDFTPGTLLVKEAGGVVANLGARTFDYRNLDSIAANPEVFAALTEGPDAIFPIA